MGLIAEQAEVFLREAGSALIDSWRWQADRIGVTPVCSQDGVRDLLSGISGRRLASRVGLTSERTWGGLRALVPAVLGASSSAPASDYGRAGVHAVGTGREGAAHDELEIGFGLRVGCTPAGEAGALDGHPIFGRLLRAEDGLA